MARLRGQPSPAELLKTVRQAEARLRILGSKWADDIPPRCRLEILAVANGLLRILLRADQQP